MATERLPWVTKTTAELTAHFGVELTQGLSEERVHAQRAAHGHNLLPHGSNEELATTLGKQITNPLIIILIIAGLLTWYLGELLDAIVIVSVIVINVTIGAYQELRAQKAFAALIAHDEHWVTVLRSGTKHRVLARELVPGDVLLVTAGDRVGADARLVEAIDLSANESELTGEWEASPKEALVLPQAVHPAEARNMLFAGTLVVTGQGSAIVVATGEHTELGIIAEALKEAEREETALERSVRHLSHFLSWVVLGAILTLLALGVSRGEPLGEIFLIAVAIAVAAIPEGLPIAVTGVLAVGLETILKKGGLVKNLLATETLGSTTVILTDKTGTLTEARMAVASIVPASGVLQDNERVLAAALRTTDAFVEQSSPLGAQTVHGRPIEQAIVSAALEAGISRAKLEEHFPRRAYRPFDAALRYAAAVHGEGKNVLLSICGAPELILERSRLTAAEREHFLMRFNQEAGEGVRLIAVAERSLTELPEHIDDELVQELRFVGLIGFHDPLRSDVAESIAQARGAGIHIVMVTGDTTGTATRIARAAGIYHEGDEVLTGGSLTQLTQEELTHTTVFARVLPEEKRAILNAFKDRGEVVAMTGDGVNDAPALRHAHIGVALGSGTDVAKAAADLVLLNNSFTTIVASIREGRRIMDNLKKIIVHLLSTGLSEILLIGSALVSGIALPLLPVQILWHNILSEGFLSFAFAFEPAEEGVMQRDPRSAQLQNVLSRNIKQLILATSLSTGILLSALAHYLSLSLTLPPAELRTLMFMALTVSAIVLTFSVKNLEQPLWRINIFSNRYLIGALIASLLLLTTLFMVPSLAALLSLVAIPPLGVGIIAGVALCQLALIEGAKWLFCRPQGLTSGVKG